MIVFLIKSTICLALLYFFYYLFLEKQKMHHFNRFFLLSILVLSIVIPIFSLNFERPIISPLNVLDEVSNSFKILDYIFIILPIYLIITSILLVRFIRNLIFINNKIKQNINVINKDETLVLLKERVLPHTFFNFIFLNKEDYETKSIKDELFTHESTHVKQKHTIDILIIELFQIIFWFNPILVLLKKSIRLNHEFLADETVINIHQNTSQYQHILLGIANWNNVNGLTSNLNYSLTKRRFKMMVKKSSHFSKRLAKFSVLPLLIILVLIFSNSSYNPEHNQNKLSSEHSFNEEHIDNNEHRESVHHD